MKKRTTGSKPLPSLEKLRSILSYNSETGAFTWKARPIEDFVYDTPWKQRHGFNRWHTNWAGKPALVCATNGYYVGSIDGITYKAHRIAWKMHYGVDPDIIDHINGNPLDNRIANLRSVNSVINGQNKALVPNRKTGVIGVRYSERANRYFALIGVGHEKGHPKFLGCFKTLEEAVAERKRAESMLGYSHREKPQPQQDA